VRNLHITIVTIYINKDDSKRERGTALHFPEQFLVRDLDIQARGGLLVAVKLSQEQIRSLRTKLQMLESRSSA
jgi:hypothetical protein